MAGDDPAEAVLGQCGDMIRHFHVSEPHLVGLGSPSVDHGRVGEALCKAGYQGWVSIEMRRVRDPLNLIGEAVGRVSACYDVA